MRMRITVLIAALALGSAIPPASADPLAFGIVGAGGASIPIVQDDNNATTARFGLRFPASTGSIFSFEPYIFGADGGTAKIDVGGSEVDRDGFATTGAGMNIALGHLAGRGFRFYPFGGIGSTVMSREGLKDVSKLTWNFGLGLGTGTGNLLIDLRGEANVVDMGDTSRKWAAVTLGLGYRVSPDW